MSPSKKLIEQRQQTRSSYNKLSRWYDLISGRYESKYSMQGIKILNPQPGDTILEVGFGTGHSFASLVQSVGESGAVYGIELSEGMILQAKHRVKKQEIDRSVKIVQGDVLDLPFRQAVFDAVFISFTLEIFGDAEIPLVLTECKRCLRPDGRICVVALSKKNTNFMTDIYEWSHRKFPKFIDCRPIFVQQSLETTGFKINSTKDVSMMGLQAEIIVATPN